MSNEPIAFKGIHPKGSWYVLTLDVERWNALPHGTKLYVEPPAATPPPPVEDPVNVPTDVLLAAQKVERYFANRGVLAWKLGGVQSRWQPLAASSEQPKG